MENTTKKECLLRRVEEQEITARKFGFYWEHFNQLIEQIQNEATEAQVAWQENDRNHLQEEIGDLLQAAVSLAVFCDFDPHETLLNSIEKFQKRYDKVVQLAQNDGHNNLQKQPFSVLMSYWKKAKNTSI